MSRTTSDGAVEVGHEVQSPEPEKKLSSRFRGVCWNRKNKRWQSAINRAGRYIYLGSFEDEVVAARAFDKAAVKLRGSAAKINFAFADYAEEMAWYRQMGDMTDLVVKNPRLLREAVHTPPPRQQGMPSFMPSPQPAFPGFSACTMTPIHLPYAEMATGHGLVHPLQGRVISSPQRLHGLIPSIPINTANMYCYGQTHNMPFEMQPMQSTLFADGENGMLAPNCSQYEFASHLSDPAIKAEPVTTRPPTSEDTFLPVVNMPDGASVTHLYRGKANEFAMGFVRKEAAATEVLLYDGRSMHEVGSFSCDGDASQTCKNLLRILNSVKSTDSGERQPAVGNSDLVAPVTPAPVSHKSECKQEEPMPICRDKPDGESPFKVNIGETPKFGPEQNEEHCDMSHHAAQFKSENGATEPHSCDLAGIKADSFHRRMGSLLHMDPSLSFSNLGEIGQTLSPLTTTKDCRSETSTKVFSSLSLINSGSLKNIVAVFNQSGNFSIMRKEEIEEDEEVPCSEVQFRQVDEPLAVGTPKLYAADRSSNPFTRARSDDTENNTESLDEMPDPSRRLCKRKSPSEMEIQEHIKKHREAVVGTYLS